MPEAFSLSPFGALDFGDEMGAPAISSGHFRGFVMESLLDVSQGSLAASLKAAKTNALLIGF